MDNYRPGLLTDKEVQQLQRSLTNRSVREVALTVCTIKGLAAEVQSIIADLFPTQVIESAFTTL